MKYYTFKELVDMSALSRSGVAFRLYKSNPKAWGVEIRNGQSVVSQSNFKKYWMDKMTLKRNVKDGVQLSLEERVKIWRKNKKGEN